MTGKLHKALGATAAAALITGAGLAATAAPAQAAALGCPYPYTCLSDQDKVIDHKYQVVTSGFQSISNGVDVVYGANSRNDDVVYVRYTTGLIKCMAAGKPNTLYDVGYYGIPNGIRIDSASTCAYGPIPPASK
ncbi:hypothetical protein [Micromonospora sp. NPDC049801]|uniref:hypothetical protein n=1 Tax=unclassified Micromonospora TaxID=2617518 RepID=UPI0033E29842